MQTQPFVRLKEKILENCSRIIVGKEDGIEQIVVCLIASGHILLEDAPGIRSVSGLGLMLDLRTEKPAAEVVKTCMENGVLCLTAKDKVRLLPALNIPDDLLRKAAEIIREACCP